MFVYVCVRVCICMLLRVYVCFRVFLCKGECMIVFVFDRVRVGNFVCACECLGVFVCVSV